MKRIIWGITTLFCTCFFMAASANPIVAPGGFNPGQVNIQQNGSTTTVNQYTHSTFINWNQFNINKGETTTFNQPSRSSVAVNRINGAYGGSQIYGTLNANGRIILINQAGIYFGPGSFVNVGSIIASTSDMSKFNERKYVFDIPSKYPNAAIVNRGTINAADYGLVALIGNRVENTGNITAHAGTVIMGAGSKFTLDFVGDQLLNFSIDEASSSNGGSAQDVKDLGTVHVHPMVAEKVLDHAINTQSMPEASHFAQAANGDLIFSNGKIDVSATKPDQVGGKVKLLASNVQVKNAVIDASGDAGGGEILIGGNYQGKGPEFNASSTSVDANTVIKANALTRGNGGKVIVWSDGDTNFHGSISAQGGALGGNGGFVETSGHYLDVADAKVNLLASNGKTGTWLLDPTDLTISAGATSNVSTLGNTYTGDANFTTSTLNVSTLTTALNSANVVVQTTGGGAGAGSGDIIVGTPIGSGGNPAWTSGNTLTLSAYRNIQLNNNITSSGAAEVILHADNTGTGTGTITGGGVITTASGTAKFYYNPSSYTTPTDFSGNVSGTTLTAYMLVNNVTQLQNISTNTTGSYALGRDIDASATSGWNGGLGFAPIASFSGQLDGLNHTISNLFINRPAEDNVGLIGSGFVTNASFIANLGLSNPNITGHSNVGGIVGYLEPDAAGITPIQQTYVSGGSISGADFVGGLVGQLFAGSSFPGTVITDVYNTSNVSGGSYVGGIVGWAADLVTIQNAYNKGSVTGVAAGGNASTGGILGYSFSSTILNSFNTGAISGGDLVGGLVGYGDQGLNVAGNTVIQDSYNLGSVTGGTFAGGIAAAGLSPVFTNVFNSGYVSGSSGSGGLAFDTSGGTTTNGYWDTQTSGQSSSDGGTGMTTAALQAGLPTGFSGPTWSIIAGYSYPYLSSFYSGTPQAVSGFAPGGSAGASGLSGSTVQIATNGVNLSNSSSNSLTMGSVTTGNNGYYYFFEPDAVVANSSLLAYLTSGGSANAVTASSTASIAGLNMAANTVTVGDASTQTLSNTNALLGTAKGALSSNILYSTSGSTDLTLNSGISLSSTPTTTYNIDGDITASGAGNITFNAPVTLAKTSVLTSDSGNIGFGSTLNGAFGLTVNTAGITSFSGIVGGTTPLTSVTTDASGSTSITADITTSGAQTYNDAVNLGSGFVTLLSNGGNNITFNSTVDGTGTLALQTNGVMSLNGIVGGTTPLTTLVINFGPFTGTTNIAANVTAGTQFYNSAITLTGSGAKTFTSNSGSSIQFFGTLNGAFDVAVNTSNLTTFGGIVGGTTPLTSLTTDAAGTTQINSNISTTGAQTFNDPVTLSGSGAKTLASSSSGNIGFGSTLNGAFDLIANTAGTTSFGGIVGGSSALTSVTTDSAGTTSIGANISTTGAQTYNDAVTLTGTSTLASSSSGNIGFGSTLNGAFGLTANTAGTTSFGGIVGGSSALSSLTTDSAGTTSIAANVSTTGSQTYNDAVSLTGGSSTTLTANGDIVFGNGISGVGKDLNLTGGSANNNFSLSGALSLANLTINGVTGTDTFTLQSTSPTQTWTISSANGGAVSGIASITGTLSFSNIGTLTGGSNTDDFTLSGGTLSGSINGGSGTNTLTADNVANTWSITGSNAGSVTGVTGGFTNIQNLVGGSSIDSFTLNGGTLSGSINGNGGTNTLTGDNVANTWNITGSGAGSVTGVTGGFTSIQNLVGGSSTDNFNISGGTLSGSINGGGGNNTLTANNNLVNTWNIAGTNLGGATSIGSGFTNIQNLVGGTNTDTFTFFAGTSIAGSLTDTAGTNDYIFSNGSSIGGNLTGSGNDDLSVAGFTTPVIVSLAGSTPLALVAGTISGISQFTGTDAGSGTNSTIEGPVGSNSWIFTGGTTNTGTINGSISFVNFGNVANNSSNNTFTFQNNANLTGNLTGSGTDTLNISALSPASVNLSTSKATGIGGTFSGINNFIGAGTTSSLVGPASNTTWSSTGTDSGTAGNSNYSNFGNITGGSGINTFIFTNSSIINGLIDGGSGPSNVIDFSGYAQPLTLTLTSLNSGSFKDSATLAMVANFVNFTNIVGPVNSAIQLPTTTNILVFKPLGVTQSIAQVNGMLNFNFAQFNQIYGGSALDSVDLSHVTINNPKALFSTSGGHTLITFNIDDPIDVTFFDITDIRGIPTSAPGNVTETLTQGISLGTQALANAPPSTTPTTSATAMMTTATQAIDTAFGNTKVSNERPGGGCASVAPVGAPASKALP